MLTEPLSQAQLNQLSPPALASVGDSVYDLMIRAGLCADGVSRAGRLHRKRVEQVNAQAQAGAARRLEPHLTAEEADVFRRGRNTRPGSIPPSASREDYQAATAFETLLGWLYLSGRYDRLRECFAIAAATSVFCQDKYNCCQDDK